MPVRLGYIFVFLTNARAALQSFRSRLKHGPDVLSNTHIRSPDLVNEISFLQEIYITIYLNMLR